MASVKGKPLTILRYLTWCEHLFSATEVLPFLLLDAAADTTVSVSEGMAIFMAFLNSERIVNSELPLAPSDLG